MALAEFLKQVDLEEIFHTKRGEIEVKEPKETTPLLEPVNADNECSDSASPKTSSIELIPFSSTISPPDNRSTLPLPITRQINKRTRGELSDDESTTFRTRLTRRMSQLQTRQRLHSVIEELWNLVPEEKRGEGIQFSTTEKVEIAIEHLRNLQGRLMDNK